MTVGGGREGIRFPCRNTGARRQQRTESLAETRGVGIRGKQPDVIADIGEGLVLLQFDEHVGQRCRTPWVKCVNGQRPDVRMLNQIALDAGRQVGTVDGGADDSRLGQPEGFAHLADQASRVFLMRRRVQRPERVQVIDRGKEAAVRHREHRGES